MDNFIEYLWYLLTTPLKRIRKSINKWYILCEVWGKRFDDDKEAMLRARDEGMVATACHDMLPIHAAERGLTRYTGEDPENFRSRIALHEDVCRLGGLNEGILMAVRSLGYNNPQIERAVTFKNDPDRWAEFFLIIVMSVDEEHPIGFDILRKTVRKWKEVEAKDNYYMEYRDIIREPHTARVPRITYRKYLYNFDYLKLDGKWQTDGSQLLDAVIHDRYRVCVGFYYSGAVMPHTALLTDAAYRYIVNTVATAAVKMLYRFVTEYPEQARVTRNTFRLVHDNVYDYTVSQLYRMKDTGYELQEGRTTQSFRAISDYFEYLKLDGSWRVTGSRLMNARRMSYGVRQSYRTSVAEPEQRIGRIVWHEEHNLFFLDGTWSLDGTKTIDAYQNTEVM